MKYFINAQGSVGDVRPAIALGIALQEAGYDVIIGAPPNNSDLVLKYNLPFRPVGIDAQKFLELQMHKLQGNPVKYVELFLTIMSTVFTKLFDDLLLSTADCDHIISTGFDFAGYSAGEYHNIPWRYITHSPIGFQSKFHPVLSIKNQNMPHWMNAFTWSMQNNIFGGMIDGFVNKARKKAGMGKIKGVTKKLVEHSIVASDPLLVPMPPDIKEDYIQTGYFFLDDSDELDEGLKRFIKDGPPPVYLGFGSMTDPKPLKTSAVIRELISQNKYRFVISKGWAKLTSGENYKNAYFIDPVPHVKLFPETAVVIHHGGAGTTHTAARAGVPQIVVPHTGDQFYHGDRVFKLNIGQKPVYRSQMSACRLLASIDGVMENEQMKNNAQNFSVHLKEQNGTYEFLRLLKSGIIR
jgi:UDP:flavonoid glycosyltransferase YjiC (YdhE family)